MVGPMRRTAEVRSILETMSYIELIVDAFRSGASLLTEFDGEGHDVRPVRQMLQGFADELLELVHNLPIEPGMGLIRRIRSARLNGSPSDWLALSVRTARFLDQAERKYRRAYPT